MGRVIIFGATGRTGRRLTEAALARGVEVAVFVRDATRAPEGVREIVVGDVLDPIQVRAAIRAGDLVVSTLGGAGPQPGEGAVGAGARHLAAAVRDAGAARVLGVVGAGVLQLEPHRQRHEAPDYPAPFRAIGAEHQAMHRAFAESGAWWALVCTPRIVDGDPTGHLVRRDDYLPEGTGSVTTGDVAALLLELALEPTARFGRVGVNTRHA